MTNSILDVVANDVCVGCGACSIASQGAIPISFTENGYFAASVDGCNDLILDVASRVCPFANESPNETEVANDIFPGIPHYDDVVGGYESLHVGRVSSPEYLLGSSSGGLTSWFLIQLMERGLIDGVVHVGSGAEKLFEYLVSSSDDDLRERRKSMYFSTTTTQAVESVRGDGKRYAFVGVPCFVTAMRHVCREDTTLSAQFPYFVGLVCGHLKSSFFAESLSWQSGVEPSSIDRVDFRVKNPDRGAGDYDFGVQDLSSGQFHTQATKSLVGGNWGHGMFQMNSCNFCDDIFGETADVTFGDAWLPEYRDDWEGMNIVVSRRREFSEILEAGAHEGSITLRDVGPAEARTSQAGNVRHRRVGLSVRLQDDRERGQWAPVKRVTPGYDGVSPNRIDIIRKRRELSEKSFDAFREAKKAGALNVFLEQIQPILREYDALHTRESSNNRILRRLPLRALVLLARIKRNLRGARRARRSS